MQTWRKLSDLSSEVPHPKGDLVDSTGVLRRTHVILNFATKSIDVVVATCGGPAHILRNDGGNENNWIALDLRGTKSNRDGIGARVKLTSESGRVQYGTATTTASYQSVQDRRVFFGVGQEKVIREIEVDWPSGAKQILARPEMRKTLAITEK